MKAIAFCDDEFWNNKITDVLIRVCLQYGIQLDKTIENIHIYSHKFNNIMDKYDHVICKRNNNRCNVEELQKKNTLYVEDDIFGEPNHFFIDSEGWDEQSSFVTHGINREEPNIYEREELRLFLINRFNCALPYIGKNKKGFYLAILQTDHHIDKKIIDVLENFGNKNITICFDKTCSKNYYNQITSICEQNGWNIQKKWDNSIFNKTRAIVTGNSSLFVHGLAKGIPIATTEEGIFTHSHCTLECCKNLKMVHQIDNFIFDREAAERMLCSIYRHRVSSKFSINNLLENKQLFTWLSRII